MKIVPDTNILVRVVVLDDELQAKLAAKILKDAEIIAVTLPSLCELVWVLRQVYRFNHQRIAAAIHALLGAKNIVVNRPAVDAGLAVLEDGGDFADGVIAYEGVWLGGEVFVSFDKKAVKLLNHQGKHARLLT